MSSAESPRPALDPRVRFVLAFFGFAAVGLLAYCFPYREHGYSEAFFDSLLSGYARLAYGPISLIDSSAILSGTEIHGQYAIRIVKGCDAMEAKILFVSAILAFPGAWRRKLIAALLGVLALAGVNLLRIASLYYVGMASPNLVELLHLEVWPLVLIVLAAGLFLLFVQRSTDAVAKA